MFEEDMIENSAHPTDEPVNPQAEIASDGAVEDGADSVETAAQNTVSDSDVNSSPDTDELQSVEEASIAEASASEDDDESIAEEETLDDDDPNAGLVEEIVEDDQEIKMDWYILKVASNRENTIREGLSKRVRLEGYEDYFGEIIVPTEKITEFKNGKKRVREVKLYPGYIVVQMALNDATWFLVRETSGIGDFTGAAGKPASMQPHEIERIRPKTEGEEAAEPTLNIAFNVGDQVKVNDGNFENFEGEVDSIDLASGRVTVMINIFGRSTPVELEYWQIETV